MLKALTCQLFALGISAALVMGHTPARAAAAPDSTNAIDEILVRGKRSQLDEARAQIVKLEDHFYERYNALNPVRDFDVSCVREAKTGTRMEKRSCRVVYQERAIQQEGQDATLVRQNMTDSSHGLVFTAGPPVSANNGIDARRREFEANMKAVVARDPKLVQLLKQRAEAAKHYDDLRRELFGLTANEP